MIGNWVYDPISKEYGRLVAIEYSEKGRPIVDIGAEDESYTVSFSSCDCIDPIPLTPEILEKCGFVYRRNFNDYAIPFKSMRFAIAKSIFDETGTWYLCDYKANHSVEFQYVHQLQNLFWIITGTDLPLTFN